MHTDLIQLLLIFYPDILVNLLSKTNNTQLDACGVLWDQ